MDDSALVARWQAIWDEPVSGWDFSAFGDRLGGDEPPWSYDDLARDVLAGAASVVDLGTGGGEVLLSMLEALPPDTTATEGWPPNLPVARAALAPHGIAVTAYDAQSDPRLPFPDGRFEVVLDRHEAYDAGEVARVLRPGGRFLTQQVDGRDLADLGELFGSTSAAYDDVTLGRFRSDVEAAGLTVDLAGEWTGALRFRDVDTLVGYLAMIPWGVGGFTVESGADTLLRLHRDRMPLAFTQHRFVLRAHRPRPGR